MTRKQWQKWLANHDFNCVNAALGNIKPCSVTDRKKVEDLIYAGYACDCFNNARTKFGHPEGETLDVDSLLDLEENIRLTSLVSI